MLIEVGVWFTEEWLEKLGPQLLELGFHAESASTDPVSPGLYVRWRLDYTGEAPLPWEKLEATLKAIRKKLDKHGQEMDVFIVPGVTEKSS